MLTPIIEDNGITMSSLMSSIRQKKKIEGSNSHKQHRAQVIALLVTELNKRSITVYNTLSNSSGHLPSLSESVSRCAPLEQS